jgi:hypothetical protein
VSDRPRIAYLVTSHRLPEQVLRLVTLLRRGSPQATILVHHNDVECTVDRAALAAVGADLVEPPTPVQWGEFSQVAMLLRCIRRLLAETRFEWMVLLSGQDYPIRPLDQVERELGTRGFDAYIEMFRCERPASYADYDEFASRYHYRWHVVPHALRGPALRLAPHVQPFVRARTLPAGVRIGVPALRSPFGAGLVCHYGPDWFTLSRRAAEAVERFAADRPDVVRHFRHTLYPSESFVHTILAGEPGLTLAGGHHRYLVYGSASDTGPRVLRRDDLDAILSSQASFARKFDQTVDASILDELDSRVHAAYAPEPAGQSSRARLG